MDRLARLDRGQLDARQTGIFAGSENFTQAWGLDAKGNWTTFNQADTGGAWTLLQSRTNNTINEITAITAAGWVQPSYDSAGNLTEFPQPGAPSSAEQAVFDAWNRMVSVSKSGFAIQANAFDGLTRRISKALPGALEHHYFSLGWHLLEQHMGSSTTPTRQCAWGMRYSDDLLLRDRVGDRLYALQDPNRNVTALCSSSGGVQERYTYTP